MKHIIYTVVITILLVQIMAMKQSNKQPAPIYNRVSNKVLIKAIEEFVEKYKGTEIDKEAKFLLLRISKEKEYYYASIIHMNDACHNTFDRDPIVVCAPIAGKKILVYYPSLHNRFVLRNPPDMALYFKEDCPEAYRDYMEEYDIHKNMIDCIASGWLLHSPTLEMKFDFSGNLIESKHEEY